MLVVIDAKGIRARLMGEAIGIEIGDAVLIAKLGASNTALRALQSIFGPGLVSARGGPYPLEGRHWPEFFLFTDSSDPASIVEIKEDDIGAFLGDGYKIRLVTIGDA